MKSLDALQALLPQWQSLASLDEPALSDPVWYLHAIKHVHGEGDLVRAVTLWEGDRLDAVAPLMKVATSAGMRYELAGARVLYEPTKLFARDAAAARGLALELSRLDRPLTLTRLAGAGEFAPCFRESARHRGLSMSPRASGSHWIDLSAGWEAYERGLSSKLREMVARGRKQLSKVGKLEFQMHRPGADEAPALLRQAFELEMKSWKCAAGSAVLLRPDLRGFFLEYGVELARRGELAVSLLSCEGQAVAMHVARVSDGTYWLLKIGFDEAFSRYRVGWQLIWASIQACAGQGIKRYEFLGTQEGWLRDWSESVHRYSTTVFYPFKPMGLVGLMRDSCGYFLAKMGRVLSSRSRSGAPAP